MDKKLQMEPLTEESHEHGLNIDIKIKFMPVTKKIRSTESISRRFFTL